MTTMTTKVIDQSKRWAKTAVVASLLSKYSKCVKSARTIEFTAPKPKVKGTSVVGEVKTEDIIKGHIKHQKFDKDGRNDNV